MNSIAITLDAACALCWLILRHNVIWFNTGTSDLPPYCHSSLLLTSVSYSVKGFADTHSKARRKLTGAICEQSLWLQGSSMRYGFTLHCLLTMQAV